MAKLLKGKLDEVDLIVSSPAKRALTTATYFAEAFGFDNGDIQEEKQLYHAYPEDVLKVLRSLDDEKDVILIFGHNPGYTDLANHFSDDYIDNVPTCGIFKVEAEVDSWSELNRDTAKLTAFYYPKQYFS